MTSSDQFPVPVKLAVKTNVPACQVLDAAKNLSSRALNTFVNN